MKKLLKLKSEVKKYFRSTWHDDELHLDDWADRGVRLEALDEIEEKDREEIEGELIFYNGVTWENDNVCFELSILLDENQGFNKVMDPSLTVTFKEGHREDWKEDYWDSGSYLLDILNGKKNREMVELFNKGELEALKVMLGKVRELGWFKYTKVRGE